MHTESVDVAGSALEEVYLEPMSFDEKLSPGITRGIGGFRLLARRAITLSRGDVVTARGVDCEVINDPEVWPLGTAALLRRIEVWDAVCTITRTGAPTMTGLAVSFTGTEVYDGDCRLIFRSSDEKDVAGATVLVSTWALALPADAEVEKGDSVSVTARAVGTVPMTVVTVGHSEDRDELLLGCES